MNCGIVVRKMLSRVRLAWKTIQNTWYYYRLYSADTASCRERYIDMPIPKSLNVAFFLVFYSTTLFLDRFANAAEMPLINFRQPGLWEIDLGQPWISMASSVKVRQCVSKETDQDLLFSLLPDQEHCDSVTTSSVRNLIRISTTCYLTHRSFVKTRLKIKTEAGRDRFTGIATLRYSGMKSTLKRDVDALPIEGRRVSPVCPEGIKVGEMELSNGVVVNVLLDRKQHENEKLD